MAAKTMILTPPCATDDKGTTVNPHERPAGEKHEENPATCTDYNNHSRALPKTRCGTARSATTGEQPRMRHLPRVGNVTRRLAYLRSGNGASSPPRPSLSRMASLPPGSFAVQLMTRRCRGIIERITGEERIAMSSIVRAVYFSPTRTTKDHRAGGGGRVNRAPLRRLRRSREPPLPAQRSGRRFAQPTTTRSTRSIPRVHRFEAHAVLLRDEFAHLEEPRHASHVVVKGCTATAPSTTLLETPTCWKARVQRDGRGRVHRRALAHRARGNRPSRQTPTSPWQRFGADT